MSEFNSTLTRAQKLIDSRLEFWQDAKTRHHRYESLLLESQEEDLIKEDRDNIDAEMKVLKAEGPIDVDWSEVKELAKAAAEMSKANSMSGIGYYASQFRIPTSFDIRLPDTITRGFGKIADKFNSFYRG